MIGIVLKIILITYYFVMASIAVFLYVDSKDSHDKWNLIIVIIFLVFVTFAIGVTCALDFRWHDIGEELLR